MPYTIHYNKRRICMDKRKDRKGRVLHTGESQLATGRYIYKYKDTNGDIKYIYSWRLTSADKTPAGKKEDIPLREKIKDIQKNLYNGIVSRGKDITVLSLVEKYIAQKKGVKHNTEANYQFVINIIKGEEFGRRYTRQVKISDAKEWLIKLQKDGRGYSTIHSVRGVVRPAFQMAVDDGLIVKNPFEFQLATVVVNDSVTREAVTRKQERAFLGFVKNDRHFSKYYEGIYILFNTGLRISEFTGLTISDIDFKDMKINVDHQLQRKRNMEYIIETTKTKNGTRFVPTTGDVAECLKKIIRNRKKPVHEPVIDGKTGFLYLDKNGMPMVSLHWEKYFQHICEKYNKIYKEELPKITPHVCRHTFCSNMAKSGMNPKVLQEIMGHSDISVTLDTYTHLNFDDIKQEMKNIVDKVVKQ